MRAPERQQEDRRGQARARARPSCHPAELLDQGLRASKTPWLQLTLGALRPSSPKRVPQLENTAIEDPPRAGGAREPSPQPRAGSPAHDSFRGPAQITPGPEQTSTRPTLGAGVPHRAAVRVLAAGSRMLWPGLVPSIPRCRIALATAVNRPVMQLPHTPSAAASRVHRVHTLACAGLWPLRHTPSMSGVCILHQENRPRHAAGVTCCRMTPALLCALLCCLCLPLQPCQANAGVQPVVWTCVCVWDSASVWAPRRGRSPTTGHIRCLAAQRQASQRHTHGRRDTLRLSTQQSIPTSPAAQGSEHGTTRVPIVCMSRHERIVR